MAKGSPIVPIRIPADLLIEVEEVIVRSWDTRAAAPWNRTTFILAAIREKLSHLKRSSRKRKGGKREEAEVAGAIEIG